MAGVSSDLWWIYLSGFIEGSCGAGSLDQESRSILIFRSGFPIINYMEIRNLTAFKTLLGICMVVVVMVACSDSLESVSSSDRSVVPEILLAAEGVEKDRTAPPEFKEMPRREERSAMVEHQIARRGVKDQAVLEAMRRVPRHELVPSNLRFASYEDRPLPIGHGQTISQPYIVGYMTEILELKPGDTVLEVGTGSGYQAAILARIVRHVVTMEIINALAKRAAADLGRLGYKNITVLHGDGYFGYETVSPFDAIIVTAAAEHIPPPLLKQLKPGGRMVIPVGASGWTQNLMLVEKQEDGRIVTRNILPVRFVPLTRQER